MQSSFTLTFSLTMEAGTPLQLLLLFGCVLLQATETSTGCPTDFYGTNCSLPCGRHCQNGCDQLTGTCFGCRPGHQGLTCDRLCRQYKYGHNCIHACGHCAMDEACDVVNGICRNGCIAGWRGHKCDQACPRFKYGVKCEFKCGQCKHGNQCNKATGNCIGGCDPGRYGEQCDKICPKGFYGVDCSLKCGHCDGLKNDDFCNPVTGSCVMGCGAGWRGHMCDQICATGFYGTGCAAKCGNCKNGSCDHVTGACPHGCSTGWKGLNCQIKCPRGTYGVNCTQACGQCLEGTSCEQINGVCLQGCDVGWQGIFCDRECARGFYGAGCKERCGYCSEGSTCNRETGECSQGCRLGWTLSTCTEKQQIETQPTVVTMRTILSAPSNDPSPGFVIPLLTVAVLVLVAGLVTIAIYHLHVRPSRNRKLRDHMAMCENNTAQSTTEEGHHVYEPLQNILWELEKSRFKISREMLGNGQFGKVRKGFVIKEGKKVPVAVKSLKENVSDKDKEDFMNELKILKTIGCHPNVICLVGSCHMGETLFVALEFACHGDLRSYLRSSRANRPNTYSNLTTVTTLSQTKLLGFGLDAARGLRHLQAKQIIHRDVAARNILLDNYLTAKVADFGLSKHDDTYIKTSNTRVPVRWMALESLFRSTYTPQSDVWAFGVLLWEIVTLGGTPYWDIESKQLYDMLLDGYRLPKPYGCDNHLYQLMYQCWMEVPDDRPTFVENCNRLQAMMEDRQVYMNLNRDDEYHYADIKMDKDEN